MIDVSLGSVRKMIYEIKRTEKRGIRKRRRISSCCVTFLVSISAQLTPSASTVVGAAEKPTFDKLVATRQRPLFSPTRRPPPEEKPRQTTDAERQPPDVVLNAIIIGPGVEIALLKRGRDTKPLQVSTGADLDGWSVTEITSTRVALTSGTRSITLEFPKRANVPVPLPAGPTRRADITR